MKTVYVVIDPLVSKPDAWELHTASLLQGYVEVMQLDTQVSIQEIIDLYDIKLKFDSKLIHHNDVFLFPNAWTSSTIYVRNWAEQNSIAVKMIGFWSRGCYINDDTEFRPLGDRNWRKVFERASFRCLDKSIFISEYFKEQFRIYVSKNVFPERLRVASFPLDYLSLETDMIKPMVYKQDMIIFPWQQYSELNEQIVYDFIRVYEDVKIVFAQERLPLDRSQLLTQVAKSKIAFLPYTYPNIGKEIYECLLLNTIPLVPALEGFQGIVPTQFQYPPEWTSSILNYSRYAPDFTEKIRELLVHYNEYVPLMEEHAAKAGHVFYSSEFLINEIFGTLQKN